MLAGLGADLERLQPEIGERADIDVIHLRMAANFLVGGDELAAPLFREPLAVDLVDVRADGDLVADVLVRLGVFVRNRARADDAYSH